MAAAAKSPALAPPEPPHAAPYSGPVADHPIWPDPRAEMTDPTAIRLRLAADILAARARVGYTDAHHALEAGWTPAQLGEYFIDTLMTLGREGRLPRIEKAAK